jgi:hypothetical protein
MMIVKDTTNWNQLANTLVPYNYTAPDGTVTTNRIKLCDLLKPLATQFKADFQFATVTATYKKKIKDKEDPTMSKTEERIRNALDLPNTIRNTRDLYVKWAQEQQTYDFFLGDPRDRPFVRNIMSPMLPDGSFPEPIYLHACITCDTDLVLYQREVIAYLASREGGEPANEEAKVKVEQLRVENLNQMERLFTPPQVAQTPDVYEFEGDDDLMKIKQQLEQRSKKEIIPEKKVSQKKQEVPIPAPDLKVVSAYGVEEEDKLKELKDQIESCEREHEALLKKVEDEKAALKTIEDNIGQYRDTLKQVKAETQKQAAILCEMDDRKAGLTCVLEGIEANIEKAKIAEEKTFQPDDNMAMLIRRTHSDEYLCNIPQYTIRGVTFKEVKQVEFTIVILPLLSTQVDIRMGQDSFQRPVWYITPEDCWFTPFTMDLYNSFSGYIDDSLEHDEGQTKVTLDEQSIDYLKYSSVALVKKEKMKYCSQIEMDADNAVGLLPLALVFSDDELKLDPNLCLKLASKLGGTQLDGGKNIQVSPLVRSSAVKSDTFIGRMDAVKEQHYRDVYKPGTTNVTVKNWFGSRINPNLNYSMSQLNISHFDPIGDTKGSGSKYFIAVTQDYCYHEKSVMSAIYYFCDCNKDYTYVIWKMKSKRKNFPNVLSENGITTTVVVEGSAVEVFKIIEIRPARSQLPRDLPEYKRIDNDITRALSQMVEPGKEELKLMEASITKKHNLGDNDKAKKSRRKEPESDDGGSDDDLDDKGEDCEEEQKKPVSPAPAVPRSPPVSPKRHRGRPKKTPEVTPVVAKEQQEEELDEEQITTVSADNVHNACINEFYYSC